jgi:hypothetical protein
MDRQMAFHTVLHQICYLHEKRNDERETHQTT